MSINRGIADFLGQITDPALDLIKKEFLALLNKAKEDALEIVKENVRKAEEWGVALATGEMTRREYEHLCDSQKRTLETFLTTVQIEQKARLERLTIGLLDILTTKLLSALLDLVPK